MVRQEVGDKVLERIKGMDAIRTATRHLIDIQLSGCSEQALRQAQEELNTVYDQFTKKYGYITAKGNTRAFRDDGDYLYFVHWKWWMRTEWFQRQICLPGRPLRLSRQWIMWKQP